MSDEKNELDMELHKLAIKFKDDHVNLEKAIKELADITPLDKTINFMKEKSKTANLLVNTSDPANVSVALTPLLLSETQSQKQIQAPPAEPEFTKEEQAKFAEMENKRIAAEEEAAQRNPHTSGGKKRRKTKKKKKSKKRKTKRRYKTGKRN